MGVGRITNTDGIDVGLLTNSADFTPRRASWNKFPVVRLEIEDDTGEWRYINLRPGGCRALIKGLGKMVKVVEELDR
jgi:hypothetical protein